MPKLLVSLESVAAKILNEEPVEISLSRKVRFRILQIDTRTEPIFCQWKRQWFLVPRFFRGESTCLRTKWLIEVRVTAEHKMLYQFTKAGTGISGHWRSNPTGALKSAYQRVTGEMMTPSQSGREQVGVFSLAFQSIVRTLFPRIVAHALMVPLTGILVFAQQEDRVQENHTRRHEEDFDDIALGVAQTFELVDWLSLDDPNY